MSVEACLCHFLPLFCFWYLHLSVNCHFQPATITQADVNGGKVGRWFSYSNRDTPVPYYNSLRWPRGEALQTGCSCVYVEEFFCCVRHYYHWNYNHDLSHSFFIFFMHYPPPFNFSSPRCEGNVGGVRGCLWSSGSPLPVKLWSSATCAENSRIRTQTYFRMFSCLAEFAHLYSDF